MREAAFFDTFPSSDNNGFSGAWSVYPFFESGLVIVSDISRELFILSPHLSQRFKDAFEMGGAP